MRIAEPKVYLLAYTHLDWDAASEWLAGLNGSGCINHIDGAEAEQLIELAARRCYKSFVPGLNPNVTKVRTSSDDYHKNILESLHGSVLEHATSTWAFENVSRVFTHELVRNRVGNAFSQESLRYVRLSDGINYWLPPEIAEDEWATQFFAEKIEQMSQWQRELADHFKIDEMKSFARKKKLTSAFRRVAPIGLATGIVFTCNMRSLRWLIEQRSADAAEYEMRLVANKVAKIAVERWPKLFQDFINEPVDDTPGVDEWKPTNHKV